MARQFLSVSILFTAIAATNGHAQAARIHDSAGVRIVENPPLATAPIRFKLAEKADFVVGGIRDNPQDELAPRNVWQDAVRLPGGRLLVADATQLKIFDAKGSAIKVLGRSGAGPGEFKQLQSICRFRGDSILAWDVGNRRVSIWSPEGKLAREYPSPAFMHTGTCMSDGTIAADGPRVDSARDDMPLSNYLLVSTAGIASLTFGPLPATFYSGSTFRDVKFGFHGEQIYFGGAVETSISVLDRHGKLTSIMRTSDAPKPMTVDQQGCAMTRATKTCTPTPTKMRTVPAFRHMLVDGDGRVWIGQSDRDSVWAGFGADGKLLGKLRIPQGAKDSRPRLIAIGTGEATIADFDADGAARISVYRIVATPP